MNFGNTTNQSDFAGLGAAPMPNRGAEFMADGTYIAEVIDVKKRRSTNPTTLGDLMVIIELVILEVIVSKEYITPGEQKTMRSNVVGDMCAHIIKMKWTTSFSTVKSFLRAAMQMEPSVALELDKKPDAWEEIADRAVYHLGDEVAREGSEDWTPQPLKGATVKVKAKTKAQTKNPHLDFTVIEYFAADTGDDS